MSVRPRAAASTRGDPSDESLIAAARAGDHEAFRALVERYEGAVAVTAIGMLGAGADAEDVGQEVFVRFHRALGRFRGDAALKTYLTRIAINLSLNALKRRGRQRRRFVSRDRSPDEAPLPEPAVDGVARADAAGTAAAIEGAMAELSEDQRAVVVLRLIDGYSTREAAGILGIPEGTVTSRLLRARQRLERTLRPLLRGNGEPRDEPDDG